MADATRQDREAAVRSLLPDGDDPDAADEQWIASGGARTMGFCTAYDVAQAIAAARAEGYARGVAEADALAAAVEQVGECRACANDLAIDALAAYRAARR